jgi:hypothetical protein
MKCCLYQIPFYFEMVGVHLISWGPIAGIVEHLLQEFYHLASPYVVGCFLSRILKTAILSCGVDLFLQGCYPVG